MCGIVAVYYPQTVFVGYATLDQLLAGTISILLTHLPSQTHALIRLFRENNITVSVSHSATRVEAPSIVILPRIRAYRWYICTLVVLWCYCRHCVPCNHHKYRRQYSLIHCHIANDNSWPGKIFYVIHVSSIPFTQLISHSLRCQPYFNSFLSHHPLRMPRLGLPQLLALCSEHHWLAQCSCLSWLKITTLCYRSSWVRDWVGCSPK